MPKADKTKGSSVIYSTPKVLTDQQKDQIIEHLGTEDEDETENEGILRNIEYLLGTYEKGKIAVDQKPTPASYLVEIIGDGYSADGLLKNGLRKQVYDLCDTLANLSGHMRQELEAQNIKVFDIVLPLCHLGRALRNIEIKYTGIDSRKRPPKKTRQIIVNHLKIIYEQNNGWAEIEDEIDYWDENEKLDRRQKPTEKANLIKFIRACLQAGKIECPKKDGDIEALFYNEKTPQEERIFFTQF
jgi:hypothetical protein